MTTGKTAIVSDIEVARAFIKAVTGILSTMAGLEAKAGMPFVKKENMPSGDISALIGVTGPKCGTIAVSFTRSAAEVLVAGMLGDDVMDMDQDMQDAVGEVTNMVSGQARAALAEKGMPLQGATPSVITGQGHCIKHMTSSPVMAIPFALGGGSTFTVEFCLE